MLQYRLLGQNEPSTRRVLDIIVYFNKLDLFSWWLLAAYLVASRGKNLCAAAHRLRDPGVADIVQSIAFMWPHLTNDKNSSNIVPCNNA